MPRWVEALNAGEKKPSADLAPLEMTSQRQFLRLIEMLLLQQLKPKFSVERYRAYRLQVSASLKP